MRHRERRGDGEGPDGEFIGVFQFHRWLCWICWICWFVLERGVGKGESAARAARVPTAGPPHAVQMEEARRDSSAVIIGGKVARKWRAGLATSRKLFSYANFARLERNRAGAVRQISRLWSLHLTGIGVGPSSSARKRNETADEGSFDVISAARVQIDSGGLTANPFIPIKTPR